uniref:AIG1-type G domain-containing protein n=1 Tax=Oncorhynchus tshawytscha TaxID=74940 RepID=A0A8C8LV46_ONCTS
QGVRKILTSCENRGFRSVAFPVVGTGVVLRFPHNVVTQVLLEEIRRIVLLGKTGGGKSIAGNTIFGQDDVFLSDSSSISATQKCKAHTKNIKGRNITLIDTPGFFDTDIPEEELKPKIVKCITECAPGPHAFLIVLKVERYTVHENEAVVKIETYFSPEAFKYATVLFTHGDQLNGLTVENPGSHKQSGFSSHPASEPERGPEVKDIRIVLLGKTGGGKSSAGNTIFGQDDVFLSDSSSTSSTQKCKAHTKNIKGRNITLIDTPGFFDTDIPEEELKPKIVKCITECAPGPHAFLIVLKVERYTVHENEAVAKIKTYFSPEAFKYATVLFTHGDQLNGLTVEKFVQQNADLNKLVEKCGGRYHVIDNKYWNTNQQGRCSNQYQVAELLNTIEKMVRDNGGGFYTNEMLQEAERLIQAEIEGLRKELKGQMSEEEMRKQAKKRARKKLLIKWSGIATGAVVGALFGVILAIMIPLSLATQPLITLVKSHIAASMTTGPVLTLESGVGVGSGIGAGVGIAAGVVVGMAAAAGAVRGGIVGATAAEEAETVQEAAEEAANAVFEDAKGLYHKAENIFTRFSKSK